MELKQSSTSSQPAWCVLERGKKRGIGPGKRVGLDSSGRLEWETRVGGQQLLLRFTFSPRVVPARLSLTPPFNLTAVTQANCGLVPWLFMFLIYFGVKCSSLTVLMSDSGLVILLDQLSANERLWCDLMSDSVVISLELRMPGIQDHVVFLFCT